MKDFSFITNSHPAYIEGLYQDFVRNPDAVDPEFRRFFEGFDFAVTQGKSGSPVSSSPGSSNGTANGSANGTYAAAGTTATGAPTTAAGPRQIPGRIWEALIQSLCRAA